MGTGSMVSHEAGVVGKSGAREARYRLGGTSEAGL